MLAPRIGVLTGKRQQQSKNRVFTRIIARSPRTTPIEFTAIKASAIVTAPLGGPGAHGTVPGDQS